MDQPEDTFYAFVFDNDQQMHSVINELLARLKKMENTNSEVYRAEGRDGHQVYLNHLALRESTGMSDLPQWRWKYNRKKLTAPHIGRLARLFPQQT
ncbi:MAG: hypothetical protein WA192_02660 [Candidatus Acidiferrales bacterium]